MGCLGSHVMGRGQPLVPVEGWAFPASPWLWRRRNEESSPPSQTSFSCSLLQTARISHPVPPVLTFPSPGRAWCLQLPVSVSVRLRQPCFCPSLPQDAPYISPCVRPGPFLLPVLLTCQLAGYDYSQSRLAPGGTQGGKPPALRRRRLPLRARGPERQVSRRVSPDAGGPEVSVGTVNSSSLACERSSFKAGSSRGLGQACARPRPRPFFIPEALKVTRGWPGGGGGSRVAFWER